MLLTIIVPMYNVAGYLETCINNIKIEDVNYEIIMVNDGSPDDSLNIANQLKEKNSRIRVLSQENKGLGGARNLGIKNAKGKYILFLDADDILIKQEFSFLKYEEAEIIEFSSKNILETQTIVSEFNTLDVKKTITGIEYCKKHPYMFSACNKLYKTDFLITNNLSFKEHIYIEDFEFNSRAYFLSNKVKACNEVIQHFVQVQNSITRNSNKEKKNKLVNDMVQVALSLNEFKNQFKLSDEQQLFFKNRFTWLTVDVIYHSLINKLGDKSLNYNLNQLKENNLFVLSSKLKHRNKNLFRTFLKFPFSLTIFKLFYSIK